MITECCGRSIHQELFLELIKMLVERAVVIFSAILLDIGRTVSDAPAQEVHHFTRNIACPDVIRASNVWPDAKKRRKLSTISSGLRVDWAPICARRNVNFIATWIHNDVVVNPVKSVDVWVSEPYRLGH